jgi:hypothetical protein
MCRYSGSAPKAGSSDQISATSRKLSRTRISRFCRRTDSDSSAPLAIVISTASS